MSGPGRRLPKREHQRVLGGPGEELEKRLEAYLEAGPEQAPERVSAAVRARVAATEQRPRGLRLLDSNLFRVLVFAAGTAALIGAFAVLGQTLRPEAPLGSRGPAAASQPSTTAGRATVPPEALQGIDLPRPPKSLLALDQSVWALLDDGRVVQLDLTGDLLRTVRPSQARPGIDDRLETDGVTFWTRVGHSWTQISKEGKAGQPVQRDYYVGPWTVAGGVLWLAGDNLHRVDPAAADDRIIPSTLVHEMTSAEGFAWAILTPGSLIRIDPGTDEVRNIPAPAGQPSEGYRGAWDVAADASGVWTTNPSNNETVRRFDRETGELVAEIPAGERGTVRRIVVAGGQAWALHPAGGLIVRIDPQTNSVVDRLQLDGRIRDLTVAAGQLWLIVDDQLVRLKLES